MSVQQTLLTLLGNGDFEKTLNALKVIFEAQNDKNLLPDIALLNNRYNRIKSEENRGVADTEDARREKNRIAEGLIGLIAQVPDNIVLPERFFKKDALENSTTSSTANLGAHTLQSTKSALPDDARRTVTSPSRSRARNKTILIAVSFLGVIIVLSIYWLSSQETNTSTKLASKDTLSHTPAQTLPTNEFKSKDQSHPDTIAGAVTEKMKVEVLAKSVQKSVNQQDKKASPVQTQPKAQDRLSVEKPKPTVPEKKFDFKEDPAEGMARIGKDGKKGFLNVNTGQIIGWYDDFEKFKDGRAYVKQNGHYFYIDKNGHCVDKCN